MHPGFLHWWKRGFDAQAEAFGDACGVHVGREGWHGHGHGRGHGPEGRGGPHGRHGERDGVFAGHDEGDFGGGAFGVRRPLRFLAFKLELADEQVAELATVLEELKIERAQAALDHRRTTSAFADAVAAGTFDDAKARDVANDRVKAQERLQGAVAKALAKIHALLNDDQRKRLAYLIRTGALGI